MSDQYEIIEPYKPLGRPKYPASRAEKELMLFELRVLGSASPEELLNNISRILRRPFLSFDSMRSTDVHTVIEYCQRERRRQA